MQLSLKYPELSFPVNLIKLHKIPPATKLISIAYISFTLALYYVRRNYDGGVIDDYSLVICPILQLVPSQIFHYPLSIVLSNLIDVKLCNFLLNIANLIVGGSFIENTWESSYEMVKFIIFIGSLINLTVCVIRVIGSWVFPYIRLDTPINGNYIILLGFSIIYKQLIPETTIFEIKDLSIFSNNIKFKSLPIFVLTITSFIQLVWFHDFFQLINIWITFYMCWIYLRFYQVLPTAISDGSHDSIIGDASDTFQLIYFFPELLRPGLKLVFNWVYLVCVEKLKIVRNFGINDINQGNSLAMSRGAQLPAEQVAEERRKQLALQVLEQRISENESEV